MTKSLVELADEARRLSEYLIRSQGEVTPEVEEALAIQGENLPRKIDSYKYVLDDLEAARATWKARKDEAAREEKKYANVIERLKERIRIAMRLLETNELNGQMYRFKLSKSASRLVISDETLIPNEYMQFVQTVEPNKEKIKEYLAGGELIPGCELVSDGALRIYTQSEGEL